MGQVCGHGLFAVPVVSSSNTPANVKKNGQVRAGLLKL